MGENKVDTRINPFCLAVKSADMFSLLEELCVLCEIQNEIWKKRRQLEA